MLSARDATARFNIHVGGDGDRPLVFAHGFGCDQNMWRFLVPQFESDFRVVCFDSLGMGGSDRSAYDPQRYWKLDDYAEDLLLVCRSLDLNGAIVVGHSVSGMIAALASIQAPAQFERLVMVAPSPCYLNDGDYVGGFEKQDLDGLLETMEHNYIGWAQHLAPAVMQNPDRPELSAELQQSFCSTDPVVARRFAQATFYSDNRDDLPRVPVPSLILQCAQDMIAPLEVGRYLQRHLPASSLHYLAATGHCPHLSHPAETTTAIRQHLSSRSA